VIGGSGGLGSVIVRTLVAYGTDVAFTYRNRRDPAEIMAADIRAQGHRSAAYRMVLTDRATIIEAVETAAKEMDGLHTLVYAAGEELYLRYISQIDHDRMAHHIESDIMGFFDIVQAVLPHLRKTGGSVVACCSSGLEKWPIKDALSVIPKAGIMALVRGIAREEGRFGVRANAIGTGVIDAGITQTGLASGDVPQNFIDGAVKATPLGRIGDPEDIAEAVAYFASRRAQFVTGQLLNVDGGWTL
jgi:NAD(P)-dependent dehydrogenase (short-subunit alcohol dehydrogenase family)